LIVLKGGPGEVAHQGLYGFNQLGEMGWRAPPGVDLRQDVREHGRAVQDDHVGRVRDPGDPCVTS